MRRQHHQSPPPFAAAASKGGPLKNESDEAYARRLQIQEEQEVYWQRNSGHPISYGGTGGRAVLQQPPPQEQRPDPYVTHGGGGNSNRKKLQVRQPTPISITTPQHQHDPFDYRSANRHPGASTTNGSQHSPPPHHGDYADVNAQSPRRYTNNNSSIGNLHQPSAAAIGPDSHPITRRRTVSTSSSGSGQHSSNHNLMNIPSSSSSTQLQQLNPSPTKQPPPAHTRQPPPPPSQQRSHRRNHSDSVPPSRSVMVSNSDLELARRMQQLEDIGLGHNNDDGSSVTTGTGNNSRPQQQQQLQQHHQTTTTTLPLRQHFQSAAEIDVSLHMSVRSDITAHNLHDFPRDDEIPLPSSSTATTTTTARGASRVESHPSAHTSHDSSVVSSCNGSFSGGMYYNPNISPDPSTPKQHQQQPPKSARKKKRFFGLVTMGGSGGGGGGSETPRASVDCTKSVSVIHGLPMMFHQQPQPDHRFSPTTMSMSGIPSGIPSAIPPPPPRGAVGGIPSAIPPAPFGGNPPTASAASSATASTASAAVPHTYMGTNMCCVCGLTHGPFLQAFGLKYHPECFRCASCHGKIDSNDPFKYTTDESTGKRLVHHRECFLAFGTTCVVCSSIIPANPDGRVPFIRHPFFESQVMCTHHRVVRRCHSCHRFEPQNAPFLDLMDAGRCVCPACFRTIRLDQSDVQPLWRNVLTFLENNLGLPIWGTLRDLNVIVVGSQALREQMVEQNSPHVTSTAMQSVSLFDDNDACVGICLLTGLPQHTAGSALAHEALHIWLRGHPQYGGAGDLPSMVEEGLAVLTSVLYLNHQTSLDKSQPDDNGPSNEKLRQYLKFCVERDISEVFGAGYRKAAKAYRDIGMEALLTHVLQYKTFPST